MFKFVYFLFLLILPLYAYVPSKGSFSYQILSPSSLIGTAYYQFSLFTPGFINATNPEGSITTRITIPHPLDNNNDGCAYPTRNMTDGSSYEGTAILLIRAGRCTSQQKLKYWVASKPAFLIIYDNSKPSVSFTTQNLLPFYDLIRPNLGIVNEVEGVGVIGIGNSDGATFFNYITANPSIPITIQIQGTGYLQNTDRYVLQKLIETMSFPVQDATSIATAGYGANRAWNMYELNRTDLDPCLSPIAGVCCENGHISALRFFGLNIGGVLPPEIGLLQHLKFLELSNTFITSLGSGFCSLTSLEILRITASKSLTVLPNCFNNMPNLRRIDLATTSISVFPPSLLQAGVNWLYVQNNLITYMPPQLSTLTGITYLDLSYNLISQPFISVSGWNKLIWYNIGNNYFSGSIPVGTFDNMPSLVWCSMSTNRLTGAMPNFAGTINLINIDISNNAFSGMFPTTWSSFVSLIQIQASNNQITSPAIGINPSIFQIPTLQYCILSGNNLINNFIGGDIIGFVITLVFTGTTSKVQTLDISYNQLYGTMSTAQALAQLPSLSILKLNNNNLTGAIASDLFAKGIPNIDLSNNQLSGNIPTSSTSNPASTSKTLYLNGNPNLILPNFPTWITQSTTQLVAQIGATYICPKLESNIAGFQFTLDAVAYSYKGCSCVQGYYASPNVPYCNLILASAVVNLNNTYTFDNLQTVIQIATTSINSLSLTDAIYDNQRYIPGINTYWSIDASKDGLNAVATVILLFLNLDTFQNLGNEIIVYSGDFNLKGTQVFNIRGDQTSTLSEASQTYGNYNFSKTYFNNTGLFIVQILNDKSEVQFISADTKGKHFIVEYYGSTECPTGYYQNIGECIAIPFCTINDYSYYTEINPSSESTTLVYYKSSINPCISTTENSVSLPNDVSVPYNYLTLQNSQTKSYLVFAILGIIMISLFYIKIIVSSNGFIRYKVQTDKLSVFKEFISFDSELKHYFSSWPIWRISGNQIFPFFSIGILLSFILIIYNSTLNDLNNYNCKVRLALLIFSYAGIQYSLFISNLNSIKQQSGLLYSQGEWKKYLLHILGLLFCIILVFFLILISLDTGSFLYYNNISVSEYTNFDFPICDFGVHNPNTTKILLLLIILNLSIISVYNVCTLLFRYFTFYNLSLLNTKIIESKISRFKVQTLSLLLSSGISCLLYLILFIYSYYGTNNLEMLKTGNILLLLNGYLSFIFLIFPSTYLYVKQEYKKNTKVQGQLQNNYTEQSSEKSKGSSNISTQNSVSWSITYGTDTEVIKWTPFDKLKINSNINNLASALNNPIAKTQILKYTQKSYESENILFLDEMRRYVKNFNYATILKDQGAVARNNTKNEVAIKMDPIAREITTFNIKNIMIHARYIYNEYIREQSNLQINISSTQRKKIEDNLCNLQQLVLEHCCISKHQLLKIHKTTNTQSIIPLNFNESVTALNPWYSNTEYNLNSMFDNETDQKRFENPDVPNQIQISAYCIFEEAMEEVLKLLQTNTWNKFQSSEYAGKTNDLIMLCSKVKEIDNDIIESLTLQLQLQKKVIDKKNKNIV